jgi:hypothetical protein
MIVCNVYVKVCHHVPKYAYVYAYYRCMYQTHKNLLLSHACLHVRAREVIIEILCFFTYTTCVDCLYKLVYTHTYKYVYVYVHFTYTRKCIRMYACIYIYMYVYIYIYIYMYFTYILQYMFYIDTFVSCNDVPCICTWHTAISMHMHVRIHTSMHARVIYMHEHAATRMRMRARMHTGIYALHA